MKHIQRFCKVEDFDKVLNEIAKDPNQTVYEVFPFKYRNTSQMSVVSGRMLEGDLILHEILLIIKVE